ncbi:MAG: TerC/Alx family metal homeostasis membrane protein [Candidatus Acidiferrales bacterium]
MGGSSIGTWLFFGVVVAAAVAADMVLFRPKTDRVTLTQSVVETAAWIGLSVAFGIWVYISRGHRAGIDFFTAYVLEKSLSADNVFLFLVIFRAFGIAPRAQHRVLYSGIAGALVLRLAFVLAGIALLQRFHAVLYLFGAILLIAGAHMLLSGQQKFDPEGNWVIRLVRKVMPVTMSSDDHRFLIRRDGRWTATPLLLALVAIEATDVIFAADSVPAVLAITRDPFIAYSSNVFAILGLRAMYFGLAELMTRMRYLHQGLAVILLFVGAKMLASEKFPISSEVSLAVIVGILGIAAAASWFASRKAH